MTLLTRATLLVLRLAEEGADTSSPNREACTGSSVAGAGGGAGLGLRAGAGFGFSSTGEALAGDVFAGVVSAGGGVAALARRAGSTVSSDRAGVSAALVVSLFVPLTGGASVFVGVRRVALPFVLGGLPLVVRAVATFTDAVLVGVTFAGALFAGSGLLATGLTGTPSSAATGTPAASSASAYLSSPAAASHSRTASITNPGELI